MRKTSAANASRYESMVLDNVSDIIVITDLDFCVQSWNRAAEEYYQISVNEAMGKRMKDLIAFNFHNSTLQQSLHDLQTKKVWQGEVSFTNAQGQTFFFLQTVKYIQDSNGNEAGILVLGRNITESKRAEERLAKSEQFYRALIGNSLDLVLLLNADGEITFTTPSLTRILGYEAEDILHTNAFQYIHPNDVAWAAESFQREVTDNPEIKFIVVRVLRKSGEWLWCMVRGHNLLNDPAINSIAVYIHDDTPRKKATEALQQSEKRFRKLIRELPVGVLLQNAEGKIEMINHVMSKLFDHREEDIMGKKIWETYPDVIHENGRPFLPNERPSQKAMQSGQVLRDVVMGIWHERKQERIWIMTNSDPVFDEAGKLLHVIFSFTDITERKKQEKKRLVENMAHQLQLTQATIDGQERERLEIGKELHDNIGQQLTTIKLFLDLAKTTADDKTMEMVNMATRGVSDIINEVRAISRTLVPPTLRDLGFIDSVNDLIDSLRSAQSIAIELDYFEFDEDLLPENKKLALFRIIQEQLNNIIKHAHASHVCILLRFTSEGVLLQINDDGTGFDVNKLRKGLGISNITNRTEILGGKVKIESSPGKGCKMQVWIPHRFSTAAVE